MEKEIELSGGKKVTMREPKLKDLRVLSHVKDEEEKTIKLIANLTMLSEAELDEFSMKDFVLIQKELEGFLS